MRQEQRKVLSFSVHLQVSALRLEPVLDELLWIVAEAQHEVPLRLQLVDVLDCLVDLRWKQHKRPRLGEAFLTQATLEFHAGAAVTQQSPSSPALRSPAD